MFSRIARRYDLMNAVMTFGSDGRWRRLAATAALQSADRDQHTFRATGPLALDIGAGTGDLALALVKAGAGRVVATDFSEAMLVEAKRKLEDPRRHAPAIDLLAGDALGLPYPTGTFDCVTNGFLLRNVADLPAALREFHRVLRPGGRLVCLEITPAPGFVTPLFRPYFEGLIPLLGRLVAGDRAAYTYLPASVRPFPVAERLAAMLGEAGFAEVTFRRLSFGVVCLHTGIKPN
jgi:demethylmenaquinone methyltransferase/2-methoxy-6-polyprenyl-1,4-benzoquinol methylase